MKLKNILFRTVEVVRDAGQTGQTKRLKDVPAFEEPENGQNDDTHSLLWTRCISSEVMRFGFSTSRQEIACEGNHLSLAALLRTFVLICYLNGLANIEEFISKCCLFSV